MMFCGAAIGGKITRSGRSRFPGFDRAEGGFEVGVIPLEIECLHHDGIDSLAIEKHAVHPSGKLLENEGRSPEKSLAVEYVRVSPGELAVRHRTGSDAVDATVDAFVLDTFDKNPDRIVDVHPGHVLLAVAEDPSEMTVENRSEIL